MDNQLQSNQVQADHAFEQNEAALEKANAASVKAIQESYNNIVLIHRHVWIGCD